MKRSASAVWNGTLKEGSGKITTQSSVLDQTAYAFNNRFGEEPGTNPEELIAAAHSGCFTMALSAGLTNAGHTPGTLETKAIVDLDTSSLTVSGISLELKASQIEGLDEAGFKAIAEDAKKNCPISKLLTGAPITLSVSYGA